MGEENSVKKVSKTIVVLIFFFKINSRLTKKKKKIHSSESKILILKKFCYIRLIEVHLTIELYTVKECLYCRGLF